MSEPDSAVYDEEVFSDELPDETLEVAGSKCWEGPASMIEASSPGADFLRQAMPAASLSRFAAAATSMRL
jgi:hypothetical protein